MLLSTPFVLLSAAATLVHAHPAPQSSAEPHWFRLGDEHLQSRANKQQYVAYAVAGINQMQTWYNAANGLWSNAWWNSANVITMLADFYEYFPDNAKGITNQVFPTTFTQAQNTFKGFINDYYDDELWWVLAWIKVYDVTNDQKYLNMAASIFEDSKNAWGTSPCGGLWWDKAHTQVGAVENELYLTAAAKLANRRPSTPSQGYYYDEAIKAYTWIVNSGLINGDNLINNGLNVQTCKNDNGYVFAYNQGILLSGLAELTWASGDNKYNDLANTIALAAINKMVDSKGIFTDPCDRGCSTDTEQFKGIFNRGIQFLVNRATVLPAAT